MKEFDKHFVENFLEGVFTKILTSFFLCRRVKSPFKKPYDTRREFQFF
jgi:hypothetical protein